MNSGDDLRNGVFMWGEPSVESLEICALFWRRIFVYERFLSDVQESKESDKIFEVATVLFDEDILKVVEDEAGELQSGLIDKIYRGLGSRKLEYLYNSADRIEVVAPITLEFEKLAEESGKQDALNSALIKALKDSYTLRDERDEERVAGELAQSETGDKWEILTVKKQQYFLSRVRTFNQWWRDHVSDDSAPWGFNMMRYNNKLLLQQLSVSSSLYVDDWELPYYALKLGNSKVLDSSRYIEGWKGLLPFIKREAVNDLEMSEIISIRKSSRWDNAMEKLASLCQRAKSEPLTDGFKREIEESVIYEYQDELDEHQASIEELGKELLKGQVLTGISMLPIVGPLVSGIIGLADPVASYLRETHKQQNLPFFLNEIKARPS